MKTNFRLTRYHLEQHTFTAESPLILDHDASFGSRLASTGVLFTQEKPIKKVKATFTITTFGRILEAGCSSSEKCSSRPSVRRCKPKDNIRCREFDGEWNRI
jgi:hypothetical protein